MDLVAILLLQQDAVSRLTRSCVGRVNGTQFWIPCFALKHLQFAVLLPNDLILDTQPVVKSTHYPPIPVVESFLVVISDIWDIDCAQRLP